MLDRLRLSWGREGKMLCVGLDPDTERLPGCVKGEERPLFAFSRAIVDATADLVCAFKPQAAYFHAAAAESELAETIAYIKERYPHLVVILDAKRGDIGATARQYALEAFVRYGADAVTVNPYMGGDTVEPFAQYRDRGVFLICRTSNPSSGDLQELATGEAGRPLFEEVARLATGRWNANRNIGLVVGAPYPSDLGRVRRLAPEAPILVPGIGAQGGDLNAVLLEGCDVAGAGLLINVSRDIIFAGDGPDFADRARVAAEEYAAAIRKAVEAGGRDNEMGSESRS